VVDQIPGGALDADHVIDERRGDLGHQVDDRVTGDADAGKRRLALAELVGAYRNETDDALVELQRPERID
jgi:hypothetical protein